MDVIIVIVYMICIEMRVELFDIYNFIIVIILNINYRYKYIIEIKNYI